MANEGVDLTSENLESTATTPGITLIDFWAARRGPCRAFAPVCDKASARHGDIALGKGGSAVSGDTLASPMQGTIVKVAVEEGQTVAEGDLVVVLKAMKMEQSLNAHKAGTIVGINAEVGATVTSGAVICEIKD